MNCVTHPGVAAVAFCRNCGKAMCEACRCESQGTVYCAEHCPPPEATAPVQTSTAAADTSPGLAFLLGLIPGVGAVYNGQYAKGLIHVVIFGLLISIVSSSAARHLEPLFGLLIAIWYFYMPFEAYHTAKKRQQGIAVDEFSSLVPLQQRTGGFPAGPVFLIGLGVLFLLMNLDVIRFAEVVRYWPVLLILLGVFMLIGRLKGNGRQPSGAKEGSPWTP